ncbi:phosphonate C-P lyase system protein PhnG [Lichenibacterium ramalinae]|nr:phosphonate C-P lyase system protein PhnG [Lichenibacterium ramalinae]
MIDEMETEGRRRAMGALACMPAGLLAQRYAEVTASAPPALAVRGPEVGLVMLRGRAGGGGAPFNLGEASVVRATVRLGSGEVGHAVILGRDTGRARMAAHLDALWQCPDWRVRIEAEVVAPGLAAEDEAVLDRAEETEATRVDFFTLVRGED